LEYFSNLDREVTIEECLEAYISSRTLGGQYHLKPSETKTSETTSYAKRVLLRTQVSQELGVMKQMGLIGRARYGVYVKRPSNLVTNLR